MDGCCPVCLKPVALESHDDEVVCAPHYIVSDELCEGSGERPVTETKEIAD